MLLSFGQVEEKDSRGRNECSQDEIFRDKRHDEHAEEC
jgi:hypothetical protein